MRLKSTLAAWLAVAASIRADLEPVRSGDAPLHASAVGHDRSFKAVAQPRRASATISLQLEDRAVIEAGVGDRVPVVRRHAAPRVDLVDGEVRPHRPADLVLLLDLVTATEGLHLGVAQEDARIGVAERPGAGDAQRLGRLGPIADPGVEGVERQRRAGQALVAHVADGQVAEARIQLAVDPGREQLVPAVEVADGDRLAGVARRRRRAGPARSRSQRREAPAEAQAQGSC